MRPLTILLLAAGLTLVGCDGNPPTGEPLTTGTLVVSTSTRGEDPDQDGYLLTVDDADSLDLDPTGRAEIEVEPGWHNLRLLGVADQCWVWRSALGVEILGGSTTSVAFAVSCPATRAQITVRTTGVTPDPDGYLLTVDDADSLGLGPTAAAAVDLTPGRHTLRLLDVADDCTVAPGTTIEVNVEPGRTIPVSFEVSCSTGASVTVLTTGLDFDPNGYRLEVDGSDHGSISANGTVLTGLEPGNRTIALTGLAPNCTFDGPATRTVTIVTAELLPIEFAVVCTATSGVIGVIVSGSPGTFEVMVDGATAFSVGAGGPAYRGGFPAGEHVVSMRALPSCSIEDGPQTVTVTTGTPIRDTVEVTFSVICETAFLVTAPTAGTIPQTDYSVGRCVYLQGCTPEDGVIPLGRVAPNGTLLVQVDPGTYRLRLSDLPRNCFISVRSNPTPEITIAAGQVRTVTFPVTCH